MLSLLVCIADIVGRCLRATGGHLAGLLLIFARQEVVLSPVSTRSPAPRANIGTYQWCPSKVRLFLRIFHPSVLREVLDDLPYGGFSEGLHCAGNLGNSSTSL